MSTAAPKTKKLWSYRETPVRFVLKASPGNAIISELVNGHGLEPVVIGQAKCLDRSDIEVIGRALGKTTEAFD